MRSPRTSTATIQRAGILPAGIAAAGIAAAGIPLAAIAREAATLDEPVHAVWNRLRIAAWADRAAELAGCPVILDRRVDPDAPVSRECDGEPLGETLAAVAASAGVTVAVLEDSIRIAPARQAAAVSRGESLRRRDIARLSAGRRRAIESRQRWAWHAGVTPRGLVTAAAADAGLAIDGLDMIPHDHLPAASLGPLTLGERLDLVLAHYDLRVEWLAHGPAGRIVPLPLDPQATTPAPRSQDASAGGRPPRTRPNGSEPQPAATPRFTLRLAAPLDEAVGMLGTRFGLEATIDRGSLAARGIAPGEIVRVDLRDASRDDLLDAVVKPLGLRWRIDGSRLVIDAAGE
jgi:hypothetical protein